MVYYRRALVVVILVDMELWITVLFWSLLGSAISLTAGFLLISKKLPLKPVQILAIPFAAGSLLAASFLDLLPEAYESGEAQAVAMATLSGFLLFFILERFLGWFHHHHEHGEKEQTHPTAKLLVIGDTLHNFIDGLVIGAAFLVDVPTGIVATLAIAAHEIPQEVGDFGLMLALGMSRKKVVLVNLLSAVATVVAALFVVSLGGSLGGIEPYLLAVAAGFFIYIAASDIIPTIHAESKSSIANLQTAILVGAIVIVGALINFAHGYTESGHDETSDHSQTHHDD